MPASLEPARPEDAAAVVQLITDTDADMYQYIAGGDQESWHRLVAHEWRVDGGVYDHRLSRVVRSGGGILGLLIAYPLPDGFDFGAFRFADTCPDVTPEFVARLNVHWAAVSGLYRPIPPGAYYVQNLAVAPAARGTGLGRDLMRAAFASGRQANCPECLLDVDSSTPAVGFYRRLGMDVVAETAAPDLPGLHAHYRMSKRLDGAPV